MKISQTEQKSNKNGVMDVSVDVHKDMLNFFFEAGGKEYSDDAPTEQQRSKPGFMAIIG